MSKTRSEVLDESRKKGVVAGAAAVGAVLWSAPWLVGIGAATTDDLDFTLAGSGLGTYGTLGCAACAAPAQMSAARTDNRMDGSKRLEVTGMAGILVRVGAAAVPVGARSRRGMIFARLRSADSVKRR